MTVLTPAVGEADLVRALQTGDAAAYRRLVEMHSPGVYRVALKLLGDSHEAEDVLQETFLHAFQAIKGFEGRSQLATWLYRIAYNASLMRLRKRVRQAVVPLDLDPASEEDASLLVATLVDWSAIPDEQLLTAEARHEMDQAVRGLPDTLRAAFVLRDIQGLSGVETAEVLGITVQAVKNRLLRARLLLRGRLSSYFAERATAPGSAS